MVNLAPAPAYRQNRHTLRPGMSASYRDLRVWQQGMALVLAIYKHTRAFPKEELYGLTSQMRRAAVSIPSSIAEGKGRSSDRDRRLFFCHGSGPQIDFLPCSRVTTRARASDVDCEGPTIF